MIEPKTKRDREETFEDREKTSSFVFGYFFVFSLRHRHLSSHSSSFWLSSFSSELLSE